MKAYIGSMLCGIIVGKILDKCLEDRSRRIKKKYVHHPVCIELFTGICFTITCFYNRYSMQTLIGWTFIGFAIVLSVIDWEEMILPTCIIGWGLGIGIIERIIQVILTRNWILLEDALMGAIVGYLFFMGVFYSSQWVLRKEGMGYGDVRLMGFIGLYTGVNTLFLAILIASLLASIYGMILLNDYKKSIAYPLGPFLNMGGLIVFLWGYQILNYSLRLINV